MLVSDVKYEVVFGGALVVTLLAPVPHALVLGLHVNLEGALGLGLVAAVRTRPEDPLVFGPDVVLEVESRGPAVVALITEKARWAVDRLHVLLEVVLPGCLEGTLVTLIHDPLVYGLRVNIQLVPVHVLFATLRANKPQSLVLHLHVRFQN